LQLKIDELLSQRLALLSSLFIVIAVTVADGRPFETH
jgi:hypothetical protein